MFHQQQLLCQERLQEAPQLQSGSLSTSLEPGETWCKYRQANERCANSIQPRVVRSLPTVEAEEQCLGVAILKIPYAVSIILLENKLQD